MFEASIQELSDLLRNFEYEKSTESVENWCEGVKIMLVCRKESCSDYIKPVPD